MFFTYYTNNIPDRKNYVNYFNNLFTICYEAINKDFSYDMFTREISNILYNFDIYDNYSSQTSISNNFKLTFIHPDFSQNSDLSNYDITDINDIFDNSNIYSKFSKIDTSFIIQYDISDSQNNNNSFQRTINIVNNIPPNIEFVNKLLNLLLK